MDTPHELAALREITPKLQVVTDPSRPWVEYTTKQGSCFGYALYYQPTVAVQLSRATKGTQLPFHAHEEVEIIIVYEGYCDLYLGEGPDQEKECVRVGPGEAYRIPPGTPHIFDVPTEDCRLVAVTVPASARYPHILPTV
jgi:quercetin dioxygenase-like cupin family protein